LEACRAVLARTVLARTVLARTLIGGTGNGATEGGRDVTLKWPNDVLLDGAKVAGILAQRSAATGSVVVGVGLNVGWAPEGAARLIGGDGGGDLDPDAVTVAGVLCELLHAFESLPVDCAERYRSVLGTIGRDVNVELPDGSTLNGRARDVDDTGRLLVEDVDGTVHRLDVGDVVHARHTTGRAATNVSSGVPRADEVPPVA
jgi:BirA family biotin operon repressor/biotin-[acetyl-CoA-carboxylase] ligase